MSYMQHNDSSSAYYKYEKEDNSSSANYKYEKEENSSSDSYKYKKDNYKSDCHKCEKRPCPERQTHVHETLGSVLIAEAEEDPHNHRFATVSGEVIPISMTNHVHVLKFRTDFYEDHFHEFTGRTGPAIAVGDRHVHFLESVTTDNEGHRHEFRVATLINDAIGD